jgi:hypothetical protein
MNRLHRLFEGERGQDAHDDDRVFLQKLAHAVPRFRLVDVHVAPFF